MRKAVPASTSRLLKIMVFDPESNYRRSREQIGYILRKEAAPEVYTEMGFMCGLEIHQQLKTEKKLFCRCPCGQYQKPDDFDAEIIRHMRPTLSEMGEYDGTALMERKTKKNIVYRIKGETACTYEFDDTPPFSINLNALDQAIAVALQLKMNIVGELHITRKQYLDGSIPTGFQRTAIVGIEGEIPLENKTVRMIQISIEEDSCREVSDIGHWRVYRTDRLGMPLIESVTYPDMLTPDEAAEAGNYLRYLVRSSGKVRTGIGAARQDVNVSIKGGTRVEIKGVAHIKWIPELTHNEAFRQKSLLTIRDQLKTVVTDPDEWKPTVRDIQYSTFAGDYQPLQQAQSEEMKVVGINLPGFKSILSFFTQPGKTFSDEISDRLKVIACLEKPNLIHSEQIKPVISSEEQERVREILEVGENDAQLVIWGSNEDVATAIETVEERCRMAFEGVPNETRKSLSDGTTVFERVLPGPDRMYPDTDSAPISIPQATIDTAGSQMPVEVRQRMDQLNDWRVAPDCVDYLLKRNLMPLIDRIIADFDQDPRFVCNLFGHSLRHLEGQASDSGCIDNGDIYGLFEYTHTKGLNSDVIKTMLPLKFKNPEMDWEGVLGLIGYEKRSSDSLLGQISNLRERFDYNGRRDGAHALVQWIMGTLRQKALGNIRLSELRTHVDKAVTDG